MPPRARRDHLLDLRPRRSGGADPAEQPDGVPLGGQAHRPGPPQEVPRPAADQERPRRAVTTPAGTQPAPVSTPDQRGHDHDARQGHQAASDQANAERGRQPVRRGHRAIQLKPSPTGPIRTIPGLARRPVRVHSGSQPSHPDRRVTTHSGGPPWRQRQPPSTTSCGPVACRDNLGAWRWSVRRRARARARPAPARAPRPRRGVALRAREPDAARARRADHPARASWPPRCSSPTDVDDVADQLSRLLADIARHQQRVDDLAWDDVELEIGGSE